MPILTFGALHMSVALYLSYTVGVYALDNGLGLTPQMGYSSWNDCGSVVTEAHIKATANYMISSGLAAKVCWVFFALVWQQQYD